MADSKKRDEFKRILKNTRIADVARAVGLHVQTLGNRLVTNCLWHEDRRPSLTLFEDSEASDHPHFHCFVCGAHGDAIDLVKQARNVEFWDAAQLVAEVGGQSHLFGHKSGQRERVISPRTAGLQLAWKTYSRVNNHSAFAQWALGRHFKVDFLKSVDVAWVPARCLQKSQRRFSREQIDSLLEAGVLKESTYGYNPPVHSTQILDLGTQYIDFFHDDRIVFPIRNSAGVLQGFAGRRTDTEPDKKYLYTPGFRRGQALYGIDRLQKALNRPRAGKMSDKTFHFFVVEGVLDALRLEYLGLNAVAILGSSLSTVEGGQLDQIKYLSEISRAKGRRLYCHLFLDRDEPGRSGMERALPELLKWAAQSQDQFLVDVIDFPEYRTGALDLDILDSKDPDALLSSYGEGDHNSALSYLSENCVPPLLFLLARGAGQTATELQRHWENLPESTKGQARFETHQVLSHIKISGAILIQAGLLSAYIPPDWLRTIAADFQRPASEDTRRVIARDKAPELFRSYHQDALRIARASSSLREFPSDPASWERLERGQNLFWHLQWERLASSSGPLEPYLPVLLPRPDGGKPRLKALPCPEDLTLQMYYILVLLRNIDSFPSVVFTSQLRKGNSERKTQGLTLPPSIRDKDDEVVSFAYQIDRNAVDSGSGALFRHYSDCWRDYNTYIFHRVRACRALDTPIMVYSARIDIRRYYDQIPEYAVVNVLKQALRRAITDQSQTSWLNLLRIHSGQDAETEITRWLCHQVFNYPFLRPWDGAREKRDPHKGIPQGPDISAWLANIVLFPVDKVMADEVDLICTDFARRLGTEVLTPVSTYARYVDDIILLAPSLHDLNRLRDLLDHELQKIGLEVSAKAEPIEPRTIDEFEGWVREHGGIHPAPSVVGFDGDEIQSMAALELRATLGALTRSEALQVLYADSVFLPSLPSSTEDEGKDITATLQIVAKAIDELRHNDWVKIAEHLWNAVGEKEPRDGIEAVREFFEMWDCIPNSPRLSLSQKETSVSQDALEAQVVKDSWPILIALEGLERVLLRKRPRGEFNVETFTRSLTSLRNLLREPGTPSGHAPRSDLMIALKERLPDSVALIQTVIDSRELAIRQLARCNDPNYAVPTGALVRQLGAIRGLIEPSSTLHGATHLVLHGLLLRLEAVARTNGSSDFGMVWKEWDSTLRAAQRDYLSVLATSSRHGSSPAASTSQLQFDALNFLISAVPVEKQHTLLHSHPHVVSSLLEENQYFLPNPDGLELYGILGIAEGSSSNPELSGYCKVMIEAPPSATEYTLTTPFRDASWSISPSPLPFKRYNSHQSPQFNPLPRDISGKTSDPRPPLETIKMAIQIYPELVKAFSKYRPGEVAASKWNVLVNSAVVPPEYHLYAWCNPHSVADAPDGVKKARAYAAMPGGGVRAIPIPVNNAHLWQAGVILADAMGLLRETEPENKEAERLSYHSDTSTYLDEVMLCDLLWILRGKCWWSRPVPSAQPDQSELRYPAAIQRALSAAETFVVASSTDNQNSKLLLILHLKTVRYILRSVYLARKGVSDIRIGILEHLLAELPVHTIPHEPTLLRALDDLDRSTIAPTSTLLNRPAQAWALASQRFERIRSSLESSDDTVETKVKSVAGLLSASCKLRGLTLFLRATATQLIAGNSYSLARIRRGAKSPLIDWQAAGNGFVALTDETGDGNNEDQWNRLSRIFDAPSPNNLNSVTPIGWLAITVVAAGADFNHDSVSNVAALLATPCISDDILDCVDEIVKKTLASTEIHSLAESLEQHLRGAIGTENRDNSNQLRTEELPIQTWPVTQVFRDERFSINRGRGGSVTISARQAPDRSLPIYALIMENLASERPASQGVARAEPAFSWSESECDGNLVGLGLVSPVIARLSRIDEAHSTPQRQIKCTVPEVHLSNQNSAPEHQEMPNKDAEFAVQTEPPSHTGVGVPRPPDLDKLYNAQRLSWQQRRRRTGRHVRVAFLQAQLYEGYHSPFVECMDQRREETLVDHGFVPSKFEANRRGKLTAALRACAEFQVDALLLPEYSVRPETVLWLCEEMRKQENLRNLSIWAGTYRLAPGWTLPSRGSAPPEFHVGIQGQSAVLSLISRISGSSSNPLDPYWANIRILQRGKKYPSVAAEEFFRPSTDILVPLTKKLRQIDNTLPIRPIDFITELICSEIFLVSSPSNISAAAASFADLLQRFGISPDEIGGVEVEVHVQKDLSALGRSTGHVHEYLKANRLKSPFDDFPRRTILFVPACTKRPVDYYLLGKTFHVSSGGCVVFCNLVNEEYSSGGSCLIGHNSWNNKLNLDHDSGWKGSVDGSPKRTSKEVKLLADRISPYHGLLPGIYLGECHPMAGPLDKSEQALVIVDIDPVHLSEGKPRPQLLPTPQQLVAHLPIFEVQCSNDVNWSPMKADQVNKLNELCVALQALKSAITPQKLAGNRIISSTADCRNPDPIFQALLDIAKSEVHSNNKWLERRANQFREFLHQQPTAWPPPAAVDWLLVEHKPAQVSLSQICVPPVAPPVENTAPDAIESLPTEE